MRTIQVEDSTYAALWAKWQPGDASEEAVIRRLLGLKADKPSKPGKGDGGRMGFHDARYGVKFPEGFEIFRVFKGKEYRARATGGIWMRDDVNRSADSLNRLSAQIGAPTENAWTGWYYMDGTKQRLISHLRDPAKVRMRALVSRLA
jgi:hypothetical protein